MRRLLALLVALPLLLTACSSGSPDAAASSSASLAAITVTGESGGAPTIEGVSGITTDAVISRVASTGDGAPLADGDTVNLNYVLLAGADGTELYSSYGSGALSTTLDTANDPLLGTTLVGQTVGSRVIIAAPATEFFGEDASEAGVAATDTLVLVAEVMSLFTEPEVTGTIDDVTVSGGFGETPQVSVKENLYVAETAYRVLVEGTGETVNTGDQVSVNYVGVSGRTGVVFDSSFESGEAVTLTLDTDNVIPGFVTGLSGRTLGSRVLLVIPYTDAYGTSGVASAGIQAGDTLVFVVDLLSKVA